MRVFTHIKGGGGICIQGFLTYGKKGILREPVLSFNQSLLMAKKPQNST